MAERNIMQLHDWLDDLCARFLMNGPKEDLETAERICFRIEEAQWYYEDFIRPLNPALPSMSLKRFCEEMFAHCPLLSPFSQERHMKAFEEFLKYKKRIPVRGAIILNADMDHVILVKGWKKGANWSFPRGKINKDEDDLDCAVREVYEETGFDIEEAGLVPEDRQVKSIELTMREQQIRLFVFRDVPMSTHFEPRTRKEISAINWWRLSDLPAFRKGKAQAQQQPNFNANNFYMVAPFLVPLRKWVLEQKKMDAKRAATDPYLPARVSSQEVFTEEDQGLDSNTEGHFYSEEASGSMLDNNSLEGATANLNRLLKISRSSHHSPQSHQSQQSQQERSMLPSPTGNSGSALLALLHNKTEAANQKSTLKLPHTPTDLTIAQAPKPPPPPHHQGPRPPHFSSMPPAPVFPIQTPTEEEAFSYQQNHINTQYERMIEAQKHIQGRQQRTQQKTNPGPHPYQPQHLIHPQPLPPHVQRAVFTEISSPLLQHDVQPLPIQPPPVPSPLGLMGMALTTSQHQGIHAAEATEVRKPVQPKLTTHSLALLNAFKSRDGEAAEIDDLHLRKFEHEQDSHHTNPNPPFVPTQPVGLVNQKHQESLNRLAVAPTDWGNLPQKNLQQGSKCVKQDSEMANLHESRKNGFVAEPAAALGLRNTWHQVSMNDDGPREKVQGNQNNALNESNQGWNGQKPAFPAKETTKVRRSSHQSHQFHATSLPEPPVHLQQQYQQTKAPHAHRELKSSSLNHHTQNIQVSLQPHELPVPSTKLLQIIQPASLQPDNNGQKNSNPITLSPRQPPTDHQKTTLLGLFRSPGTKATEPVPPTSARALPTSTPSAVELSAVEPLSASATTTSGFLNAKWIPDSSSAPQLNPEANLPFRAMKILSRPAELGNQRASPVRGVGMQKSPSKSSVKATSRSRHQSPVKTSPAFRPQILRRPQQSPASGPELSVASLASFRATSPPMTDNRPREADHKQNLLSLFGKHPATAASPPRNPNPQTMMYPSGTEPNARVENGHLAHADLANRRASQAPISPADKGFLLSYLDAVVAKGAQH